MQTPLTSTIYGIKIHIVPTATNHGNLSKDLDYILTDCQFKFFMTSQYQLVIQLVLEKFESLYKNF